MAFRAVAYQETLQNAGVSTEIARAHAKAMEEFVVGELVTRDYFRDHLDSKLVELELKMVRWVVGSVGVAAVGIVVTILVALFRVVK